MSKISIIFTLSVFIIIILIFPSFPRDWKIYFVFIATVANGTLALLIRREQSHIVRKQNGEVGGGVFVENKRI